MKKLNAIEKYNRLIDLSNSENEEFESLENTDLYEGYEDDEVYGYEDDEVYGYEDTEDLEDFRRLPRRFYRRIPRRMLRRSYGLRRFARPLRYSRFGMPSIKMARPQLMRAGTTPKPNSVVAQFDIKIQRGSANIASSLPIILFAPISFYSDYKGLIDLPSGIILNKLETPKGDVGFSFDENGLNIDTITISCPQVPYIDLLNGLFTSEFDIFKMRVLVPSANPQAYLSEPLGTVRRTMFGKVSEVDTIPFISQKGPGDFAQNIIDVDLNLHMQNDKGLTYSMPPFADSVTFSFFVNNLIKK